MKNRPTVFIGSSAEGLPIAEAVQILLDQYAEVKIWNQGVFELNKGYMESLNDSLNNFDFAILILTADDLAHSREKESPSPRDNVLFELGLFMGRLGRDRCFFVFDSTQNIKLPTDLMGITAATYRPHESGNLESALGAPCTQIRKVIASLGHRPKLLNTSQQEKEMKPHKINVNVPKSVEQNDLASIKQPENLVNPANLFVHSVESLLYRFLLSRWKLIVLSGLFGIFFGIFLGWAYFRNTVPMTPPPPNSSEGKEQDIVYLVGSGTVYRYLLSTQLLDNQKNVQVLEGPTEVGAGLFKSSNTSVLAMAAGEQSADKLREYPSQESHIYEIYLRADPLMVLFALYQKEKADEGESDKKPSDLHNFFLNNGRLTFDELREKWSQEKYDIYTGSQGSGTRTRWEHHLFPNQKENDTMPYPWGDPKPWDIRFPQIAAWSDGDLPRIYLGSEVLNNEQEEVIHKSGSEKSIKHHSLNMVYQNGHNVERGLYLYGHVKVPYEDKNGRTMGYKLPTPVVNLLNYIFRFSEGKEEFIDKDCLDSQRDYFHLGKYRTEVEGWVGPTPPPSKDGFYRPQRCERRVQ